MGFIRKVAAPKGDHDCVVPARTGLGKGTVWQCETCSDTWQVKTCIGEYETYLDWRRTLAADGRKIGFFSLGRVPGRRHPEPSRHDLDRERRIRSVLDALMIPEAVLETISLQNPSARAPYHGYQHLLTVTLNCWEGAAYAGLDAATTRDLILAALFHDFGHFQRTVRDSLNIEAAVAGVLNNFPKCLPELTVLETERVLALIRATEYPHGATDSVAAGIIQDADMMQTLEPDGTRFLDGLGKEMGRRITAAQNEEFLNAYEPRTEWGRLRLRPLTAGDNAA
jgi:hypothetical protein